MCTGYGDPLWFVGAWAFSLCVCVCVCVRGDLLYAFGRLCATEPRDRWHLLEMWRACCSPQGGPPGPPSSGAGVEVRSVGDSENQLQR